ncbi:carbohydrate ABC transporter permease [Fodinisporobacter ferrooxydans]|uniref:Carbohydrate ABC transporter permease n=1 Tax=Fodinisporobacter ferrooxydans TaxID=2901836 RepID=A0ABY4CHQ7_9BACL|nr:carbohydrate ABC transporter permease [Alicyclobacillaceae bacterium MYW30-H2]
MRHRRFLNNTVSYAILIILAAIFLFPLVWMIVSSFKQNAQIYNDFGSVKAFLPPRPHVGYFLNYTIDFSNVPLIRQAFNSLFYTALIVAGNLIVNSMAGYAFARLNFPLKRFLFALLIALLVFPSEILLFPQYIIIYKLGWINSYAALVMPAVADAFSIYILRQFFLGIPAELEEAARIDGASALRIFVQVVLPLSKPVLATVAVLSFVAHWNDFLWPLIVTTSSQMGTIQIGLQALFGAKVTQWGQITAGLTFATIPMIIVFSLFQKYYVQGLKYTGGK